MTLQKVERERIILHVHGLPAPQGSKTPIHRNGKTWMIEGGSKTGRERHTNWRQAVAQAARDHLDTTKRPCIDEPISARIAFWFPLPKSDQYRTRHAQKPDLSKLVRSTEDALVDAGLIRDDALIFELNVVKRYAHNHTPGCLIELCLEGDAEESDRGQLKAFARSARKERRKESV